MGSTMYECLSSFAIGAATSPAMVNSLNSLKAEVDDSGASDWIKATLMLPEAGIHRVAYSGDRTLTEGLAPLFTQAASLLYWRALSKASSSPGNSVDDGSQPKIVQLGTRPGSYVQVSQRETTLAVTMAINTSAPVASYTAFSGAIPGGYNVGVVPDDKTISLAITL